MPSNKNFEDLDDNELLALVIYGEARGEPIEGKIAVAAVIMNRVKRDGWFGKNVKEVILKPWQFSVFNINDPNRERLEAIALDFKSHVETYESLKESYWVALGFLGNWLPSNVGAATHYFADYIDTPTWAEKMEHIRDIGRHKFYLEA